MYPLLQRYPDGAIALHDGQFTLEHCPNHPNFIDLMQDGDSIGTIDLLALIEFVDMAKVTLKELA